MNVVKSKVPKIHYSNLPRLLVMDQLFGHKTTNQDILKLTNSIKIFNYKLANHIRKAQASQSNKGSLKLANQGKTCQTKALFA